MSIESAARAALSGKIRSLGIPKTMIDSVVRYVFDGIRPGGFLQAVFSDRLSEAAIRADGENITKLAVYGRMLAENMPGNCFGSMDAVDRWCENGGLAVQVWGIKKAPPEGGARVEGAEDSALGNGNSTPEA